MKEPIRILHILQRMEAGGTQALLMNLYRKIDRTKIQFDFLVEYNEKEFYDDEIVKLGGKIYYTNVRNDFNIFKFQKQLKNILFNNNYKIVHVHAYTIGYFCLKTAKKCGVPVRIAHSHSNNMTKDFKQYLKRIMQKLYLIHATDYMACSQDAGKYLFKNREFEVLNNSIDSKKFVFNEKIRKELKEKLNLDNNFVVGHVGRFKIEKNHNFLVQVFKKIKETTQNAKLLLIGSGPLEDDIKKNVSDLKIENDVMFLGNNSNINELLQVMDVFIFPSLYEGLGIAAIESQAAGIPTIISDGVPNETIISPICEKISLSEEAEEWAKTAIRLSKHELAHKDTQQYIIKAGYEMNDTAKWLERYYIEKYKTK